MGAITSLGQHPGQWPINETNTLLDHLLSLQNLDGSFNYTTNDAAYEALYNITIDHAWVTSYAVIALSFNPCPVDIAPPTISLVGDFDDDGEIDLDDRDMLEAELGGDNELYDLNGDSDVDTEDLAIFDILKSEFLS